MATYYIYIQPTLYIFVYICIYVCIYIPPPYIATPQCGGRAEGASNTPQSMQGFVTQRVTQRHAERNAT